jgi:hypothetical protein
VGWFSRLFSSRPKVTPGRPVPRGLIAVREIVGHKRVVSMDGERVDDACDYESVVASLAKISGGALAYDRVSCTEEADGRRLVLERGGTLAGGLVRGNTDWIDTAGLLAILNDAVRESPGRFVEFSSGYDDQSLSIAFLTEAQAARLYGRVELYRSSKALWKRGPRGAIPLQAHSISKTGDITLAVSRDGNLVASAGASEVRIWDRHTHTERPKLDVPDVTAVAFDADDELVIGTVTGSRHRDKTLGSRRVSRIAVDRDHRRLAVGAYVETGSSDGPDSWAEVWDLELDTLIAEWRVGTGNIYVAISAAGDLVATAGESGSCALWSVDGQRRFEHEMDGAAWGVGIAPDGTRAVFASERGTVVVRAIPEGTVIKRYRADCCWWLAVAADNESIAVSGARYVQIVGPNRKRLPVPELDERPVEEFCYVAWLPDGGVVAASGAYQKPPRVFEWSAVD